MEEVFRSLDLCGVIFGGYSSIKDVIKVVFALRCTCRSLWRAMAPQVERSRAGDADNVALSGRVADISIKTQFARPTVPLAGRFIWHIYWRGERYTSGTDKVTHGWLDGKATIWDNFVIPAAEFCAINRLFGLTASTYRLLLTRDRKSGRGGPVSWSLDNNVITSLVGVDYSHYYRSARGIHGLNRNCEMAGLELLMRPVW